MYAYSAIHIYDRKVGDIKVRCLETKATQTQTKRFIIHKKMAALKLTREKNIELYLNICRGICLFACLLVGIFVWRTFWMLCTRAGNYMRISSHNYVFTTKISVISSQFVTKVPSSVRAH